MARSILSKLQGDSTYQKLKILATLLVMLFAFGTIGYTVLKGVTLDEGFQLTIETLEFAHNTESSFLPRMVQVSLVLFGGVLLWFILWTFLDLLIEGKIFRYINEVKTMLQTQGMKKHYIICGSGRVGKAVADMLIAKKENVVIIEKNNLVIDKLAQAGYSVIPGDALDEEILKQANIDGARGLVAAMSDGEKNIILTLTAKEINPTIEIYARCENEALVKKLKGAGAKHVIMPELEGAKEITAEIEREAKQSEEAKKTTK